MSQLQETPEVSTGLDSLQGYELYDLVMLGPNEVGVVTRVNREVRLMKDVIAIKNRAEQNEKRNK